MVKRTLLLIALVAMLVSAAACGPAGSQGLTLGGAPWKDGERAVYDVVDRNGARLGTSTFAFLRDGDAWVLSAAAKVGQLDQTATVRIDAETLLPLSAEKAIQAPGTQATVSTAYTGAKLTIRAVVNGQERAAALDVPAGALDNDQLLMTLRALAFAEGYEGRLVNIVAANALKVNTVVRVKGKEQVTVPAGTFETWRVELDFAQAKQYAWYRVEAPHDMVQYDNGSIRFVWVKE